VVQRTLIHDAVDLLRQHERRPAVALIRRYMSENTEPGDSWRNVAKLCDKIGEIDLSVEAMRRYAQTPPLTLDRLLAYCSELAKRGRADEAVAAINGLPKDVQDGNTAILHLRGTLATQFGNFDEAEPLIRQTIDRAELTGQNWLSLAMIKKFSADDPDLKRMEKIRPKYSEAPPISQATFFYALGKAYHDTQDYDRAFQAYSEGAEIRRNERAFNAEEVAKSTKNLIEFYTPENISKLTPSFCNSDRPIFVTGKPRSGTTLVEQVLTSHSQVTNGAELNLFKAALHPAGNYSFQGALAYQQRSTDTDPWGEVAQDYLTMLDQRFGPYGRIVDKTLSHARFMGLLLHSMPDAKVIWLRRNPEDNAISVFRNYFSADVVWSWSLDDIGRYFRLDDMLYTHWTNIFPDRILTVPYEELVSEPKQWISKILSHIGLREEDAVFEPHKQQSRPVLTASVEQVRQPISTAQVGGAKAYDAYLDEFRQAYQG